MRPRIRGLAAAWPILMLLAPLSAGLAAAEAPRRFDAGSLAQIEASRAGRPFLLLVWSVECPACVKDLDGLAALAAKHPDLDLVMVSVDEDAFAEAVPAMLGRRGLGKAESWFFGDADSRRLRQAIDPAWRGELPRAYFYDAAHKRQAHSGPLAAGEVEAWRASLQPKP